MSSTGVVSPSIIVTPPPKINIRCMKMILLYGSDIWVCTLRFRYSRRPIKF